MNYKTIISSKKLRLYILGLLKFIPDEFMIRMQYRIKTGRKLNLRDPVRYTEKIQWYKLNYKNALLTTCSCVNDVDFNQIKNIEFNQNFTSSFIFLIILIRFLSSKTKYTSPFLGVLFCDEEITSEVKLFVSQKS